MFIFYSLLLVIGSCFSPVSIAYPMTLQSRTQSLQAFYPSDQKTWRVWVRDWWHREASAEGTQVNNQRWSTRISLAHFCTFQISLNLIIGCVYSEDLELVCQVPLTNRDVHSLKWHNILFLYSPLQVILKQGDKIYLQLQK